MIYIGHKLFWLENFNTTLKMTQLSNREPNGSITGADKPFKTIRSYIKQSRNIQSYLNMIIFNSCSTCVWHSFTIFLGQRNRLNNIFYLKRNSSKLCINCLHTNIQQRGLLFWIVNNSVRQYLETRN